MSQSQNTVPSISFRKISPGMGQAVGERTILRRKENGEFEHWGDVAERVAKGNSSLFDGPIYSSESEYHLLRKHIANGNTLMSGRHLQHGDETQKTRGMEVFTNCATSSTSFLLFYLLLNGSGVGRCYDDDMILVNWDYAPSLRCVLDSTHPDFNYSAHESVRDAIHKYGKEGPNVMWYEVPDSREGWAKALEIWENAAFEKIHAGKMLILDFSKVRARGLPIKGMQNRPASGPVALMDAFEKAAKLKGAGLAPWRQAIYLDHYFAECVLVGGARRAARMSTKHWSDPTIFDFITIKRPLEFHGKNAQEILECRKTEKANAFLWSSNNSVTVDDEFWELVRDPSNKTPRAKHAKKVFKLVCTAAYADGTGEPGLINSHKLVQKDDGWNDLNRGDYVGSKKYQINDDTQILMSRLAKRAKKKKYHTITNPSLRAGTNVLTQHGVHTIEQLEGKTFNVKNLRGEFVAATCWMSSPTAPLYKVTLDGDIDYYATAEHQWPVCTPIGYKKVATTELTPEMYLPVIQQTELFSGEVGTYNEGFLVGWNLGDGWRTVRTDNGSVQLGFCVHDEDRQSGIDRKLQSILEYYGWEGSILDKDEINVNNHKINEAFTFTGTSHKSMGLPQLVWYGTEDFRKGVIDALFSADGSVNDEAGIILTSAHLRLIEDVRDMLGFYGIKSRYYESESVLNGKSFTRFDLKISHYYSIRHFHSIFTLSHTLKQERIAAIVSAGHRGNARLADRIKVVSVTKTDLIEPVWDINVQDDTHCFQLSHCITGNCGEIALNVLGGFCVIADVVPFHCETLEEAEECFRVVTRALMRVNLMDSIYSKEVQRTNRIGVGMTGVHEFAYKFFGFGFKDLIDEEKSKPFWMQMAKFNNIVHEEAVAYAKELGVKPPHTETTIKPAGTTSKLFLLTEGWHLPTMEYFLRWVQFHNDDPLVEKYKAAGYPVRKLTHYTGTTIVGFPTEPMITTLGMGDKLVTAAHATPEEQFKWLMLGEKYWIHGVTPDGKPVEDTYGNQISYTLKYKPSLVDFDHFKKMILKYQSQVRCCSVMPHEDASSYEYQPEQAISEKEFFSVVEKIERAAQLTEEIGREHVGCDNGACPVDFNNGTK
jgi:ribonucleotide reductase alpha subunit